jgi:two-component system, chemotaxis family, sensor kinase CheA
MDDMIQAYMEETEDMLQRAEECIIRLEMEYSSVDVNELFRIAHTIKGSSHMVGYEDIGNLMHKIEDMLDCARNGLILFDQSIVSLCFEGLDIVKKMLEHKSEQGPQEISESLISAALRISEMIEVFIRVNRSVDEKPVIVQEELGIISSHLAKKPRGENKYYITFFIEEDAPMVSPVLMMVLNSVEDIGTLIYSSFGDDYFSGSSQIDDIKTYDIIISTDIDEAELYTYFALFYIEKINIVDISRSKVEENDHSFIGDDNTFHLIIMKAFLWMYKIVFTLSKELKLKKTDIDMMISHHSKATDAFSKMKSKNVINNFISDFDELYSHIIEINEGQVVLDEKLLHQIKTQVTKLMERQHISLRGKGIVKVFKSGEDSFISRLKNFIGMLDKSSTAIILIDLSKLKVLQENEVKDLIEVKKQLKDQDIGIGIIASGPYARRIINVFDSITEVEEFNVYRSEMNAILDMFNSEDTFQSISNRVNAVHYE